MSKTPKTDLIEVEYWDGELNARDIFERMGKQEVELAQAQRGEKVANRDFRMTLESLTKARLELAAERAKTSLLRDALSFLVQNIELVIDGDCNAYTLTPAKEALAATAGAAMEDSK